MENTTIHRLYPDWALNDSEIRPLIDEFSGKYMRAIDMRLSSTECDRLTKGMLDLKSRINKLIVKKLKDKKLKK